MLGNALGNAPGNAPCNAPGNVSAAALGDASGVFYLLQIQDSIFPVNIFMILYCFLFFHFFKRKKVGAREGRLGGEIGGEDFGPFYNRPPKQTPEK